MLPRGLLKSHAAIFVWVIALVDIALFLLSGLIAFFWRFSYWQFDQRYLLAFIVAGLLLNPVLRFFGIYRSLRGKRLIAYFGSLYLALITVMLLLAAVGFLTKTGPHFSRLWYGYWFVIAAIILTGFRCVVYLILRMMRRHGWNLRQVVIIGNGDISAELVRRVDMAGWSGFRVIALLDDKVDQQQNIMTNILVRSIPKRLDRYIAKLNVDEVWLAMPMQHENRVRTLIEQLRNNIVTIRYFPDLFAFNLINHAPTEVLGLPAIDLIATPMEGVNRLVKALEDRILAAVIVLIISPILLFIALGIKLTSKGKIIYKQRRHGWDGKPIWVYKFRSMVEHQEATGVVTQASKNDRRITPFGSLLRRTSLDELPQFINVLQGRMSIVGPRPHAIEHNEYYKDLVPAYMQRHQVKPGITGWAQVNGFRGETDTLEKMQKRVEYDLYYIENWSLWFDLKIIALTLLRGFINQNAY